MVGAAGRQQLFLTAGLAVLVLGGCGASSPSSESSTVTRLVAEANAVCREQHPGSSLLPPSLHPIMTALRKAVLDRPAGRDVSEATAKLRAVQLGLYDRAGRSLSGGERLLEHSYEVYRLRTRIYADWKAIGLTSCIGEPPQKPISG